MDKALLLHNLFVSVLGKVGLFCSEAAKYQLNNHFTGSFLPFVVTNLEMWKRFVTDPSRTLALDP